MNITAALHTAVHQFKGGTEGLAALMGISVNSLLHKVSPRDASAHCSPDQFVQVCEFTGDMGPLHALNAALGHQALPLLAASGAPCASELATAMKEASDVFVRASRALEDGRVTENELRRVEREVLEAFGAMSQLIVKLRQIHESARPSDLPV